MDVVPPEVTIFGIKAENWYFMAQLSLKELEELGHLAKEKVERRELERLKAKYEMKESKECE